MLLDARTIQNYLCVEVDGSIGPLTIYAAQQEILKINPLAGQWNAKRIIAAYEQLILNRCGYDAGVVDGLVGPQTLFALEGYQNTIRDGEDPQHLIKHQPITWPRQKDVPEFYGEAGKNQTRIKLPYEMKLAWDTDTIITKMTLHEKVAESAERAFERILGVYGEHMIGLLGLDMFGGSLNVRKMRGGSKYSMHSWGIAIDFDPVNNQLRWGKDKAKLAVADYIPFWDIWESEGWISLGREKNYDWMHIQAARL